MKKIILGTVLTLLAGMLLSSGGYTADLAVIVNKANADAVDKDFVTKAYTGEAKNWPGGSTVHLLDQGEDNPIRGDFNTTILGKSNSKMKALWAQHMFTGKALPPKVVDGDADVKKAVANDKDAIGYVRVGSVDDSVKVVK